MSSSSDSSSDSSSEESSSSEEERKPFKGGKEELQPPPAKRMKYVNLDPTNMERIANNNQLTGTTSTQPSSSKSAKTWSVSLFTMI
jgi:hypothetical protein